jgi:hypothetical protein
VLGGPQLVGRTACYLMTSQQSQGILSLLQGGHRRRNEQRDAVVTLAQVGEKAQQHIFQQGKPADVVGDMASLSV